MIYVTFEHEGQNIAQAQKIKNSLTKKSRLFYFVSHRGTLFHHTKH